MVGICDLPLEIIEILGRELMSESKHWSTSDSKCTSDLSLRLVHPLWTPSFTRALFSGKVVINPRDTASVMHLINFLQKQGIAGQLTSIQVKAPNFLQRTHRLNALIPTALVGLCHKLANLELSLDGHFVQLSDFPQMKHLTRLSVSGESVYTSLGMLSYLAPSLVNLELLAPCMSGPKHQNEAAEDAPAYPAAPSPSAFTSSYRCRELPSSLTRVHIANLNTPTNQTLLQNLPFKAVHFSYTLIHNYDLLDLAHLLCRDDFLERMNVLDLSETEFVAPGRLLEFKNSMFAGMMGRDVKLQWSGLI
ncbi:hypothetical protein P389DRAFT_172730 [Cystobasidium minutum MCA 4210]|uniref:uncharacterized protein n=1 Tax=Cystobasidium minutum MCA 4210 TaxID=1397322 RepID=UPI0034CFD86B|eukprot:jgi/Rhomi1/172730/fgenesh1_kg.5_\